MCSKSRVLLLTLAALLVVLALAAPAMAASNVAKGDTQLIVPKAKVTELQGKAVSIVPQSQITYKPTWSSTSKSLSWFYDAPMWLKSIKQQGLTYYTNYNAKAGTGVFYHNFQMVWVYAGSAMKGLKWQGIRVQAYGKANYQLIATVGSSKPYATTPVATSTVKTMITHSGKKYHIAGAKFYLTSAAQAQILAATGVTVSTTTPLFDGEFFFTLK
jgi:hypothetical protein